MNQNLWKIAIQIGRHIGGLPEFQINNSPQHSSWLRKISVFYLKIAKYTIFSLLMQKEFFVAIGYA